MRAITAQRARFCWHWRCTHGQPVTGRKYLFGVAFAYLGATSACYQPEVHDCTVHCTQPGDCTGGQVCRDDGWCAMPGVKDCPKEGNIDPGGSDTVDAASATQDAPDLCPQGCTKGTCQNGVCVIDCGTPYACTEAPSARFP